MRSSKTILMAIGGGEMREAGQILEEITRYLEKKSDPRVAVMTVATNDPEAAARKYTGLFRTLKAKHVDVVDVSVREDSFDEKSLKKIEAADAIFFTGGDQLNITSLLGGSPLHELIQKRSSDGDVLIAGTSAGAAMMSSSMIISGESDAAPTVSGVEIAPGMNMVPDTVIDSHFSERGRHGRLLTAVAHSPQVLGLGIDERTAMVVRNGEFSVIGQGAVTVVDGSQMEYSDLPYRKNSEAIGMFGVDIHVLPNGYSYSIKERKPIAPKLTKMAGGNDEE